MRSLLLFSFLLLGGCSTMPDSLQVADENRLVSYPQVAANAEAVKGEPARWGGVIANVQNQQDATLVEMLHYPIRSSGRPLISDQSIGRFRVYVDGFLDPMVFKPGRSVTVSGQVIGIEEGLVGEHTYQFPTLHASGYHLWQEVAEVDVTTISVGFGHWPYYRHGWYAPHSWYMFPYHQRVIVRGRGGLSSGGASSPSPATPPATERPKPSFQQQETRSRRVAEDMGNIKEQ
ncbi:Slp family lipoprotein [Aliiglaciecola sp. CAU 1673]|uniref:Slp family lipoprotein n=1 Tax=Aliiglaciecola sp. CAU 1673 TaxID=3032595 RepID=UPI0023DC25AF|nr:Slp family lipoprotein [Aliiglaciecola sp. CAU 1673]MDF2179835.1 Slp family lipoprotein [Aliiglaciecola sp. CAU 1673]